MDKLRRIHDKIRRSQPRETTDDMGREVPEPQKVFKTKPVKSNGPNPEAAEPELNIPQPNSQNITDEEAIKRAKQIIDADKKKQSSLDSDVIDQAVKPFTDLNKNSGLKEHIQKAVEESVKKEVDETMAKRGAACPLQTPVS